MAHKNNTPEKYLILHGDDNEEMGRDFQVFDGEGGVEIVTVHDGMEFCMRMNSGAKIDGLIIDNMKYMGGLEVLTKLRHDGWDIPVIFYTTDRRMKLEAESLKAEAFDKLGYSEGIVGVINRMKALIDKYRGIEII